MVHPGTNRGVLNDWDLSYVRADSEGHVGGERTGTIPFMALDLLCKDYWEGHVARLYRHDLEGLIWILPWVFLQFDGSDLKEPKLKAWRTGDYEACFKEKLAFLTGVRLINPDALKSWEAEWKLAAHLLSWLRKKHNVRHETAFASLGTSVEQDLFSAVYEELCSTLENARAAYNALDGLLSEVPMALAPS
jgi:hypothetical protein